MDLDIGSPSQYVDPSILYHVPELPPIVASNNFQPGYDSIFPIFPKPSVPLSSTRRLTATELYDAIMYVRGIKLKISYELQFVRPQNVREEQIEAYDGIFYDLWFYVCTIDRKLHIYACVLDDGEMRKVISLIVLAQYQRALFSSGTSIYLMNFDTAYLALSFLRDVADRAPDTGDTE